MRCPDPKSPTGESRALVSVQWSGKYNDYSFARDLSNDAHEYKDDHLFRVRNQPEMHHSAFLDIIQARHTDRLI